LFDC